MNNLKKSDKYLLLFLAVLMIVFVYLKYFLMPILDDINKNNADIDKYNSQINLAKVMEISNNKLRQERDKVKQSYNVALTKLPSLEKNPEIAYNIKPLADSNNISLESVTLSDGVLYTAPTYTSKKNIVPIDTTNLYTAGVNITVTSANYSDMMDFVNSLETDKRINEITNFSIQYQKSTATVENTQSSSTDGTISQTITNAAIVNANISINYFYNLNSGNNLKPKYDFNKGVYGKDDLFK